MFGCFLGGFFRFPLESSRFRFLFLLFMDSLGSSLLGDDLIIKAPIIFSPLEFFALRKIQYQRETIVTLALDCGQKFEERNFCF